MKISEITDHSWLVDTDQGDPALITQRNSGQYVLIHQGSAQTFDTVEQLNAYLQEDLRSAAQPPHSWQHNQQWLVQGYPVSHADPVEVEDHSDANLPLFAKRTGTDVRMCAGYYCVKSGTGWRGVFCPKLSTLNRCQWLGPFRSAEHMNQQLLKIKGKL